MSNDEPNVSLIQTTRLARLPLTANNPREIKTRNVAVWYAKDDSMVPPSHGEWLANHFSSKEGVNVDIRDENIGLDHFTYFPSQGPAFQISKGTMPQALLNLCARV